jgi:hypothetical protein
LKKAFTGQEGAVLTGAVTGEMAVGAGVITEGGGVMTDGAGIGSEVITEGVDGMDAPDEEEELDEEDELDEEEEDEEAVALPALMTVVVVEVVMDPCTHFPLTRINPNLLEQVLHPTPPSLKVKA